MSFVTKILGAIALVLIVAEIGGPAIYESLFGQLETNQQLLQKLAGQLRIKERALHKAQSTLDQFAGRAKLNFESDVAKARLSYQEYLLRLTEACGLSSVMISNSQPERVETLGSVLHFSLQATGTTDQFGRVLDGFYRTRALHRLTHVSVFQSLGPDSPTHSLNMDVAVLILDAIHGSDGTLAVPSTSQLKDVFASHDIFRRRSDLSNTSQDSVAAGMNMLSQIFSSLPTAQPGNPPETTPPPPIEPQPETPAQPEAPTQPLSNPKATVRLVGLINKGSTKYAFFVDVDRDLQYTATEETPLEKLGIDAHIVEIQNGRVLLVENGQELALALGQAYQEAVKQETLQQ